MDEYQEQDDLAALRYLADTLEFVEKELAMTLDEYRQRDAK